MNNHLEYLDYLNQSQKNIDFQNLTNSSINNSIG